MENEVLRSYTFMAAYHEAARELIENGDLTSYGHLMFAINDFMFNGNVPSFDNAVERAYWKLIKPKLTAARERLLMANKAGRAARIK